MEYKPVHENKIDSTTRVKTNVNQAFLIHSMKIKIYRKKIKKTKGFNKGKTTVKSKLD